MTGEMRAAVASLPEGVELEYLLKRCAVGDRASFRRIYDLEAPRLYGLALRLTREPQLAADAVHDAFLQLWQRASHYDTARGGAGGWITSLLRYRAIDIMRRRAWEKLGGIAPEVADEGPDPLVALTASEEGALLYRCLSNLEEGQRRAVTMAFLNGLSHSQLAATLQAPLGTVKSWVRQALQALRRCFDE